MGGPAGEDDNGDRVLRALQRENVDCTACQRVDGLATALSAIIINARGDRTIVTYRELPRPKEASQDGQAGQDGRESQSDAVIGGGAGAAASGALVGGDAGSAGG